MFCVRNSLAQRQEKLTSKWPFLAVTPFVIRVPVWKSCFVSEDFQVLYIKRIHSGPLIYFSLSSVNYMYFTYAKQVFLLFSYVHSFTIQ